MPAFSTEFLVCGAGVICRLAVVFVRLDTVLWEQSV